MTKAKFLKSNTTQSPPEEVNRTDQVKFGTKTVDFGKEALLPGEEDQIIGGLEKKLRGIAKTARPDQREITGQEINSECRKAVNQLSGKLRKGKRERKKARAFIAKKLNGLTKEERRLLVENLLASDKAKEISEAKAKLADLTRLEEKYKRVSEKVTILNRQFRDLLQHEYGGKRPLKKFYNYLWKYAGLLGLVFTCEAGLILGAIQNLAETGLTNIMILPLLVIIPSATATGCHQGGKALRKNNRKEALFSFLIAFSVLVPVMAMRYGMQASILLSVLNLAFFMFGVYLSWLRAEHQKFFNIENELVRAETEAAKLSSETKTFKGNVDAKVEAINLKYERMVSDEVRKEITSLEDGIFWCDQAQEDEDNDETRIQARIEDVKSDGLNASRKEIDNQIGATPDHYLSSNGKTGSKKAGWQLGLFALAALFMAGCSELVKTKGVVVVDVTDEYELPPAENVLQYFEDFDYGQVRFSIINDLSMPPEYPATLKKSPFWLFREEHQIGADVSKFRRDFVAAWNALPKPSADHEHSQVFPVLAKYLVYLARSDADMKVLLLFGDMIQNDKFSFYDYRDSVDAITGKAYEDIAEQFEKEHKDLRDINLKDVRITAIYSPHRRDDRLHKAVRHWWERYIASRGGTIMFLPNLQNAPALADHYY